MWFIHQYIVVKEYEERYDTLNEYDKKREITIFDKIKKTLQYNKRQEPQSCDNC